jgi:hypothetical protein
MRAKLITVFVGVFVAVASWLPLWIVTTNDPYAMPVGLGLLTFAVSSAGGVIALVGIIGLLIQASRDFKKRS